MLSLFLFVTGKLFLSVGAPLEFMLGSMLFFVLAYRSFNKNGLKILIPVFLFWALYLYGILYSNAHVPLFETVLYSLFFLGVNLFLFKQGTSLFERILLSNRLLDLELINTKISPIEMDRVKYWLKVASGLLVAIFFVEASQIVVFKSKQSYLTILSIGYGIGMYLFTINYLARICLLKPKQILMVGLR